MPIDCGPVNASSDDIQRGVVKRTDCEQFQWTTSGARVAQVRIPWLRLSRGDRLNMGLCSIISAGSHCPRTDRVICFRSIYMSRTCCGEEKP